MIHIVCRYVARRTDREPVWRHDVTFSLQFQIDSKPQRNLRWPSSYKGPIYALD